MADNNVNEHAPAPSVETTDRGLFDFMKKKDDQKPQDATLATEFDSKVQVSEPQESKKQQVEEEKKHGGLLEKLHRSDSSSSVSSSDEEDDEEKKRKKKEKREKKGLKEKLKEKLGHKEEEDTNIPIEKYEEKEEKHTAHVPHVQEVVYSEPSHLEDDHEKKGFMEKIKDKLPGHKKVDDHHHESPAAAAKKVDDHHHESPAAAAPVAAPAAVDSGDKKGFLEKIKDKIPGFSSKGSEEKKEHEEKKEGY